MNSSVDYSQNGGQTLEDKSLDTSEHFQPAICSMASSSMNNLVPNCFVRSQVLALLDAHITTCARMRAKLTVIVVDLVVRKRYSRSHQVEILVQLIASILRANIRAGDIVLRIGAQRLLVVLPSSSTLSATELIGRIERSMDSHPQAGRQGLDAELAFGVHCAEADQDSAPNTLQRAESALDYAKEHGLFCASL